MCCVGHVRSICAKYLHLLHLESSFSVILRPLHIYMYIYMYIFICIGEKNLNGDFHFFNRGFKQHLSEQN